MEYLRFPRLDVEFLESWSPARVMAGGIIFYVLAVIVAPLEYRYELVSWTGVLYAVAIISAFFVGCYLGRSFSWAGEAPKPRPLELPLDRYIRISLAIGLICTLARIYDRFILRGFTVEQTILESRDSLDATVSIFGYIGGVGYCFGLIAFGLILLSGEPYRSRMTFVLACGLASYPLLEALLQGSRSIILQTAILVYLILRATRSFRWLTSAAGMVLAALALMIFFRVLFELRTLERSDFRQTAYEVYFETAMANFAWPQAWITDTLIQEEGGGLSELLRTWVHFEQHLTHSWVIYFANMQPFDGREFAWGALHFQIPARVVGLLAGTNLAYDGVANGMQGGLFATELSYLYYDFGAAGIFVSAIYGFGATCLQAWTIRMPERWLPLHTMSIMFIAMTLIDDQMVTGFAGLAIWGSLFYTLLHYVISHLSAKGNSVDHYGLDGRAERPTH